ncbi:hypothetical protein NLI96_g10444 [Meripilus lineatus]|uniref:F-box domain-containing protein n=1 Tax=Meripilus lineatus TaxID=2056292 RepID=A0AAD5YC05_9APHY|nr:hypothetical protein NLI96_g10444 [Physisporinus lineatus]
MSSWRLPLEVCEDIIDHIPPRHILTSPVIFGISGDRRPPGHLTYRRDLCACALTCRSWVPRTRIKLFCYVLLNSPKSGQAFVEAISASPELGWYIQCLSIGTSHNRYQVKRPSEGWIYKVIQALPPITPNLHYLEYCNLPFPHPIFIALSAQFVTVKSLHLNSMRGDTPRRLAQILSAFKNVKELTITDPRFERDLIGRDFYYGRAQRPVNLNLVLGRDVDADRYNLHELLIKSGLCGSLRKLSLEINKSQYPLLDSLVPHCSRTLRVLFISFPSRVAEESSLTFFHILRLMGLSHSKIEHLSVAIPTREPIIDICDNMDDLPSSLVTLRLDTGMPFPKYSSSWAGVKRCHVSDSVLAGDRFPKLRSVELRFRDLVDVRVKERSPKRRSHKRSPSPVEPSGWNLSTKTEEALRSADRKGVFKDIFPNLYSKGLLWCGHWTPSVPQSVIFCVSGEKKWESRLTTRYEDL